MIRFLPNGKIISLLVLIFLSMASPLHAQVTTIGKEFWFGFMENFRTPPPGLDRGVIIITASEPSSGIIQYNNRTINFNIGKGEQFLHQITDFDILHRSSEVVEKKGIYINSNGNISVYAFNERSRSADGTVILPLPTLGKDYLITSHYEVMDDDVRNKSPLPNYFPNVNDESTLLVVAVEDNTFVEITPSVFTISGKIPNKPFTVTLNTGDTYQVKAKDDLTGTRVRVLGENVSDCNNIAVFGGNKWTSVGNCGAANDHLFQQAYPVNTWGTDFIHIPLLGRSSGELIKVLASENDTDVIVDGVSKGALNAGKFFTLDIPANKTAVITTSKPASVTVFAKSQECNDPNQALFTNGDPFMITYSPNQQLLKEITFNALQLPVIENHYVNIIVKSASVDKTFLDNQAVGNQFKAVPQSNGYSFAQIAISSGVHSLANADGLIGYVYGFGSLESYGFAVGASLDNLNFIVKGEYDFQVQGDKVACLDVEGNWEVFPENNIFQYFLWDFGDGSPAKNGKNVFHTFTTPGNYEITVLASINELSCDNQQEVKILVEVLETIGKINGPVSVCPFDDEITYSFSSSSAFSKVDWRVDGGEIVEFDDVAHTATVLWKESNPNAGIYALPYTTEGCPGKEVYLPVIINVKIEAPVPEGDIKICFDEEVVYTYSVPFPLSDRIYEWYVEGGEIVGVNSNPKVEINWNQAGVTGNVWYKESSILDNLCEGISPKLEVIVNEKLDFILNQKVDVLCFGDNTGSISVIGQGGTAPYTYTWSHDTNLKGPIAENLQVGFYSVKLVDTFGCEQQPLNIEISEPPLLEIKDYKSFDTSCFGKADGMAEITVVGGVPPYRINQTPFTVNDSLILLNSLEKGFYDLLISDAKGCQIPVLFEINSPLPFNITVRNLKTACPGEANGSLIVDTDNVNKPFKYQWDFDNSDEISLTGLLKGNYNVTVIDNSGCVSTGSGEVLEAAPLVRMPTGFNPKEGTYQPVSNCTLEFYLAVYNRWGELIFNDASGWDGKGSDIDAPVGTYTYFLVYKFLLDGELKIGEQKGNFTLIR
jgi:PKD repeat protein